MFGVQAKALFLAFATTVAMCCLPGLAKAEEPTAETLITNISIFNGTSEKLISGKDLVLAGNSIARIIPAGSEHEGFSQVIDGKGGYLTPGLIDIHWHAVMGVPFQEVLGGDLAYIGIVSAKEAEEQLLRGVTTIRDAAGNVFGLKRAIDQGVVPGPRVYPSGASISQYSGHADIRPQVATAMPKEWGGPLAPGEALGMGMLVNGKDQMLAAVRQQLFLGATQIKLSVTGGVSSYTDPLYVKQFTAEEIKAAVDAAEDYGTYVLAHAHSADGAIRALRNGVKAIAHGSILNEEAVKLMAKKGAAYGPNLLVVQQLLPVYTDPIRKAKLQQALDGTAEVIRLCKKHGVLMGLSTDLLWSARDRQDELKELGLRKQYFTSPEIMIQATGNGGKIVAMSGKRNPYGKLGEIVEGAMADVLIYSKNPLEDVSIAEDYENNLKLIIKDGKIYKNTL